MTRARLAILAALVGSDEYARASRTFGGRI